MRTTVTLDADTEAVLQRAMRERGVSFKQALNDAVRAGTAGMQPTGHRSFTHVRDLGPARVDLDRALRIAADLEDAELRGRLDRDR